MAREEFFLTDAVKVNHDLNFLYTIARTVLPKDILEGLMYGKDFDEPDATDIHEIEQLIDANKDRLAKEIEEEDYDYGCHICGGYH